MNTNITHPRIVFILACAFFLSIGIGLGYAANETPCERRARLEAAADTVTARLKDEGLPSLVDCASMRQRAGAFGVSPEPSCCDILHTYVMPTERTKDGYRCVICRTPVGDEGHALYDCYETQGGTR